MMGENSEICMVQRCQSEKVGVVRAGGQYYLVALNPISAGDVIFQIIGDYTANPSKYSVQIDRDLHIDVTSGMSSEEILDNCYWRFMNHCCEPTVVIRDCMAIALREISPWEEITFNYNTVEYEMAEPFECCCHTPTCMGTIKGYKYLSDEERLRLFPHTARHLLDWKVKARVG